MLFALVLAALAAIAAQAATSDARVSDPYDNAWGATQSYIAAATKSCPPGSTCLEPFSVTLHTVQRDKYRLEISNTRATSNFAYFAWILPDGMTLTRVLGSHQGSCAIRNGMLVCTRALAAHGCKCTQEDLEVDFTATGREPTRAPGGYWIHYGLVTPYLDVPTVFADAPLCTPGQKSTADHPCQP
jgi:hypothetical protein